MTARFLGPNSARYVLTSDYTATYKVNDREKALGVLDYSVEYVLFWSIFTNVCLKIILILFKTL